MNVANETEKVKAINFHMKRHTGLQSIRTKEKKKGQLVVRI